MTLIKAMWDQNTHLALEFRAINKAHGMENNTNMESSGWGTGGGELTQTFTTHLLGRKWWALTWFESQKLLGIAWDFGDLCKEV